METKERGKNVDGRYTKGASGLALDTLRYIFS